MAGISEAIGRLSRMVRCRTVSARMGEPEVDAAFDDLFALLPTFYPALWSRARIDSNPPWRLVVELDGSDPELEPVLLLAHFDVVDVEPATADDWTHAPFSGHVDEQFIWGRGTIDDKSVFCALLEALEETVNAGTPLTRGVVLAFGGDEELSGHNGAGTIAREFERDDRRFHFILDEGGVIAEGMLATPTEPVALIGVAEKGFCNIEIEADASGGHASMPPPETAVGHVARAVARAERHRFTPHLLPTIREFFALLAPFSRFPERVLYSRLRLFWPLFSRILGKRPSTDALIRTTQAATMMHGSSAANVLAQSARVVINNRILPGQSVASVLEHYTQLLKDLPVRVSLDRSGEHTEPVPESSLDHPGYRTIERLCAELYAPAIPAPFLVTGSTDSKWYRTRTDAIFRFVPVTLTGEDLARVHGTNERCSRTAFEGLVAFYRRLVEEECRNG